MSDIAPILLTDSDTFKQALKKNVRTSVSDLRELDPQGLPVFLLTDQGLVSYAFLTGDYTDKVDNKDIIKLSNTPLTQGALVRQNAQGVSFSSHGSPARDVGSKLIELASARDHGAIGDGFYHPLSEKYTTLVAAQKVYPFVTSLSESLDWAGCQKVLNIARDTRAGNKQIVAYIPAGRYLNTKPLKMASFVWLRGDCGSTIIDNQNLIVNTALLVNDDPVAFQYSRISGINFNGGKHGILIDAQTTEGNTYEDLGFALQTTSNFQTQRVMQTTTFTRCIFQIAPYGVVAPGGITNHVTFYSCEFNNHTWSQLLIDGGEAVHLINCRMEAGGTVNRSTITIKNVRSFCVIGGYIEATNENVLDETGSTDTTSFSDVHFTGAANGSGSFIPYKFTSDGLVTITNSHGSFPLIAPTNCCLVGSNPQVVGTKIANIWRYKDKHGGSVKLKQINPRSITHAGLLRFVIPEASGAHGVHGLLTLQFMGTEADGGFARVTTRVYEVTCHNYGSTMDVLVDLVKSQGDPLPVTIVPGKETGATTTAVQLGVDFTKINNTVDSYLQCEFTYTTLNSDESKSINVICL